MRRTTQDYITVAALAAVIAVSTFLSTCFFSPAFAEELFSQKVLMVHADGTANIAEVQSTKQLPHLYVCVDRVAEDKVITCLTIHGENRVEWLNIAIVNPEEGVAI